MSEPSVSPADTIRHDYVALRSGVSDPADFFQDDEGHYHAQDCRGCKIVALLAVGERQEAALDSLERILFGDSKQRSRDELDDKAQQLVAVGERDKAEIEALKVCPAGTGCAINAGASHCFHCRRNWPRDETWAQPFLDRPNLQRQTIESLHGLLDEYQKAGERDRRQIAQLTEALTKATWHLANYTFRGKDTSLGEEAARLFDEYLSAAVLADEEAAG